MMISLRVGNTQGALLIDSRKVSCMPDSIQMTTIYFPHVARASRYTTG